MTELGQNLVGNHAVQGAARDLDVILVYLFGSQARGKARPDSDLDLAVLLDDRRSWSARERTRRLDEFGERMAQVLDLPRDQVDVQDLGQMPASVALGVVEDGVCLVEAEPKLDVCFRAQVLSRYQDFEPIERMFNLAMHRRLAEGRYGR